MILRKDEWNVVFGLQWNGFVNSFLHTLIEHFQKIKTQPSKYHSLKQIHNKTKKLTKRPISLSSVKTANKSGFAQDKLKYSKFRFDLRFFYRPSKYLMFFYRFNVFLSSSQEAEENFLRSDKKILIDFETSSKRIQKKLQSFQRYLFL